MKKKSVAIVNLLSWQGIYVDGKLKGEGSKLSLFDFGMILGFDMHLHYPGGLPETKCQKYFNANGCLPKKLEDTYEDQLKINSKEDEESDF